MWEYRVSPENVVEFYKLYGPEGVWVSLFRQGTGYLGTHLLRDRNDPDRYITIDRWESEDAFVRFRRAFAEEFESLDRKGEELTLEETPLGEYQSIKRAD